MRAERGNRCGWLGGNFTGGLHGNRESYNMLSGEKGNWENREINSRISQSEPSGHLIFANKH